MNGNGTFFRYEMGLHRLTLIFVICYAIIQSCSEGSRRGGGVSGGKTKHLAALSIVSLKKIVSKR